MFERIKQMVIKEFIQTLRDKRMRAFIFGVPIMQTILFGYAVTLDVNDIRTAVYDADMSYESREYVRRLQASGYFTIRKTMMSKSEAQTLLDGAEVNMAVIIDHGFASDIKTGKTAAVQLLFDGTDSNTTQIAMGYVVKITAKFSSDIGAARLLAPQRPFIDLQTRPWYNPDLRSRNYNVPGVIAILIMLLSLLLTSMAVVREREIGTIEQLMVTPLKPMELILGKTIPFAMIAFMDMLAVTGVAVFWYRISIQGSLLLLSASTLIYLLSTLSLGLFLSTISRTQQQAMMATFLIFSPATLLSGFIFPVENMPLFFQYVTLLNPLRHFLVIIRGIFLKGTGAEVLWPQMLGLFALGIGFLALSSLRFKKHVG